MKKLLFKDKKGVLGLDTVKVVIISVLTIAVVAIAVMLALVTLGNAGIFTTGSVGAGLVTNITNSTAYGLTQFFNQVPTIFVLLAVVVLILIISIVIVAVSRFGGGARESL